jgi:uncharacterized protein YdhG (YjbR/CyaY superfamily)
MLRPASGCATILKRKNDTTRHVEICQRVVEVLPHSPRKYLGVLVGLGVPRPTLDPSSTHPQALGIRSRENGTSSATRFPPINEDFLTAQAAGWVEVLGRCLLDEAAAWRFNAAAHRRRRIGGGSHRIPFLVIALALISGERSMDNSASPPNSIDEYVQRFPELTQRLLEQVRATIRKAAPQAVETIKYQIPTYVQHENLVHFGGFQTHIGFYPTPSAIREFQQQLSGYASAKGSVQFPLDKPLPLKLIRQIVEFRIAEVEAKWKSKSKSKSKSRSAAAQRRAAVSPKSAPKSAPKSVPKSVTRKSSSRTKAQGSARAGGQTKRGPNSRN